MITTMSCFFDILSDFLEKFENCAVEGEDNILASLQESGIDLTQFTTSEIRDALDEALNSIDSIEEELQSNDEEVINRSNIDTSYSNNQETDYDSKTSHGQVNFGSSVIGHDSLYNPIFSTTVETQSLGTTVMMTSNPMTAMMNPYPSPEDAVKEVVKTNFQDFVDEAETSFEKQQREVLRDNAARDAANSENFLQKVNSKFHK